MGGVSSITFWFRLCDEQSRTPRDRAAPCPSPKICTSRCRARKKHFSKKTPAFPKLDSASLLTRSIASMSSSFVEQRAMPIPPPPAVLLSITGYPVSSASLSAWLESSINPDPGGRGAPDCSARVRARCFKPKSRRCSAVGPMKTKF